MPTTLVIGASTNPDRYSYKAIMNLLAHGHNVMAVSNKVGELSGVKFMKPFPHLNDIDTVTLYVNSTIQKSYYDYIIGLKPRRVIFNPGTENEEFETVLKENDIEPVEACTLVMLSIGAY
jgi:predicted CoA-binding protein